MVYIVTLSPDERASLSALIQKGRGPVRQLLKARILLKADASGADAACSDGQIAAALETSPTLSLVPASDWSTRSLAQPAPGAIVLSKSLDPSPM